jgi:DDE superfamily endonuclease
LRHTKKPQQKFVAHLLQRLLMLPGHATFRHLSRYSSYHERTLARWYARDFDFVSLTKAAIPAVIPPAHAQAWVIDASVVSTSGKQPYGLDRFWNGSPSRTEQGLAIAALAWLDLTDHCAYGLSVAQTPSTGEATEPEATRIDVYLEPLPHVVSAQHLGHLRDVITDGSDSKQPCLRGVRALGLEQIGTRRLDAHLRYPYRGPKRPGPGRPQTYDGKVPWDTLSRCEKVETADDDIVLYPHVLKQVQCQCTLRVVLVVDTNHHRRAVLLSPDVALDALTISRYDKARVPIELLCRDAKQCTGLTDCQARAHAKRTLHFNASWSAVTLAKLAARPQHGDAASGFSMASLKRRAFNQHLIERMTQHCAKGHSLEKSSPDYEELCHYGTIAEMAA